MPPRGDLVPQRFKGTSGPIGQRKVLAQRGRDGIAEVRESASEKLTAGLELRPKSEEAEGVVARDIDAVADLVEQRIEGPPALE